jgi:hypothetical protein
VVLQKGTPEGHDEDETRTWYFAQLGSPLMPSMRVMLSVMKRVGTLRGWKARSGGVLGAYVMSGNFSTKALIGAGSEGHQLRRRVVEDVDEGRMLVLVGPSRTSAAASIVDICW